MYWLMWLERPVIILTGVRLGLETQTELMANRHMKHAQHCWLSEKCKSKPQRDITSVKFNLSVMAYFLQPHELQHARPPCPSPTPRACSNSCPLSQWCHPTISSCLPLLLYLQSVPASRSFPMSQCFTSGGQSIGASASVLPMNIQDWFTWELIDLISLQSKGLSRVFSNTTVQKHQFFGAQVSL